jgi:hypothetical protein
MNRRRALLQIGAASAAFALPAVGSRAHAQDPLPRTRSNIVALVRSHPGVDPKSRPVQKLEPIALKLDPKLAPEDAPAFDHFVGDLHLRYVFDDPKFTPFVYVRDLKRLGIDRDELPALVVANFRRLYPKLAVAYPDRWLGLVTRGGGVEPCVMLDGAFWQQQMKSMGGEVIAAVPSVEEVYFTPLEPKQNVELLKHLAILHHEKAGKRAVSRTVFVRRNFRWEVLA